MRKTLYGTKIAAIANLLVMAVVSVAAAFPGRGGSCTSCHNDPGSPPLALTASPNPLEIPNGQTGLLTFSITSLDGSSNTAISVQGLQNPALDASIAPGGDTWTLRTGSGGTSYVSNLITSTGPYKLNLAIGDLATPGTYPIVVMYAGDGGVGINSGFDLRVLMAALAGDFNQDGSVNAADYVLWRKDPAMFGGDPAGYNTWRANFGNTSGSGSFTGAAIPEPGSAVLAALLVAALIFRGVIAPRK